MIRSRAGMRGGTVLAWRVAGCRVALAGLVAACGLAASCSLLPLGPWSDAPSEPIAVYIPPSGPVADPTLAIDSKGTLYAAWWGRGFGEIFVSKSGNRGRTWSEPLNVSNTPLGSDFPVLAVGPRDRLYLVWEDFSIIPVVGEIVVSISDDGGATWTPYRNLSQTKPSSSRPSVVVNAQGAVSIVWLEERGQITFTRSTDGGTAWSAPKEIAPGSTANRTRAPALVETPDGTLWVAWAMSNGQGYITGSRDGGASWAELAVLSGGERVVSPMLAVARDGGLYAAWSASTGLYSDIVFSRLSVADGTVTAMTAPVNISRSPDVPSVDPAMAVTATGDLICAWHEVISGDTEIFVARSSDGGLTFEPAIDVSRTPGNSLAPRVVVDRDGRGYVLWEQGVKQGIFFARLP
jgi:hypothetical protein